VLLLALPLSDDELDDELSDEELDEELSEDELDEDELDFVPRLSVL
jgi:hypothetical protein